MIGKVSRGDRVAGLLHYLYGPGRANEHTNQHLSAAWDSPACLEPARLPDDSHDLRHLADLLQQPLAASRSTGSSTDRPVWHCSLRAAPEDRVLDDAEWDRVARDVLHHTGLAPRDDPGGCRWVAVRHAEDHIHLVVTLSRQDGAPLRLFRDYYQVGQACRAQEERLGLRRTAPRDRTAAPAPTRAETQKAARASTVPARMQLRQEAQLAAASADGPEAFLSALRARGVLVRERLSEQHHGQVTGYALALPTDRGADGTPVWFGGSKLAPELSWGRLQQHWSGARLRAVGTEVAPTASSTWVACTSALERAQHRVADAGPGPEQARTVDGIALAACDLLEVAVTTERVGGRRELREASDHARRAARPVHGVAVRSSRVADALRWSARDLAHLPQGSRDRRAEVMELVQLLRATASLVEALGGLRKAQARMAQAEAAARAAAVLRSVADRREALHVAAQRLSAARTLRPLSDEAHQGPHQRPARGAPATSPSPHR